VLARKPGSPPISTLFCSGAPMCALQNDRVMNIMAGPVSSSRVDVTGLVAWVLPYDDYDDFHDAMIVGAPLAAPAGASAPDSEKTDALSDEQVFVVGVCPHAQRA
jgi:hypothetical protein